MIHTISRLSLSLMLVGLGALTSSVQAQSDLEDTQRAFVRHLGSIADQDWANMSPEQVTAHSEQVGKLLGAAFAKAAEGTERLISLPLFPNARITHNFVEGTHGGKGHLSAAYLRTEASPQEVVRFYRTKLPGYAVVEQPALSTTLFLESADMNLQRDSFVNTIKGPDQLVEIADLGSDVQITLHYRQK